jgi:hypothetical protein
LGKPVIGEDEIAEVVDSMRSRRALVLPMQAPRVGTATRC